MKTWKKLRKAPSLWSRYFFREKIVQETRNFFLTAGFHEAETPLLAPALIPESYLEVFETSLMRRNKSRERAFLTASPEIFLKKLLVAGIGNCFEICKSFRNQEDRSFLHNPEFTMLEWYRVNADYKKVMEDVESWIYHLNKVINQSKNGEIVYKRKKINLFPPWERLSVKESFRKYAGLHLDSLFDFRNMKKAAEKKGYIVENNSWEELFHQIFLNEIEPRLGNNGKPTIIYDYPKEMAALARLKPSDTNYAERFEFYLFGVELGDAYTELTDVTEQKKRFMKELKLRKQMGKIDYDYDHDFIDALKTGLPSCAGIAVGLDRLIMLLAGVNSVADTLLFPAAELFNY